MLKAKNRINKKKEIDEFFGKSFKLKKGFSASSPFFVLKVIKNVPVTRMGVIINTKVDKRAVVRNKIKRQIREIFKDLILQYSGVDFMVVVQPKAKTLEFEQMKKEIEGLIKKVIR